MADTADVAAAKRAIDAITSARGDAQQKTLEKLEAVAAHLEPVIDALRTDIELSTKWDD